MSSLTAVLTIAGGLLALVLGKVVVYLLSEEIEGRMDQIGYALIHLACRRVPAEDRESLHDQWAAELDQILARNEERPITKLIWSIRYPLPLLFASRRTAPGARVASASDVSAELFGQSLQTVFDQPSVLVVTERADGVLRVP
ncbi:hypothetical protein [Nocardia abscessus]|uniref:hypothetical protein n=1 Tax=Nocardia abscessus TaxID=120957 RepID=UPI002456D88D|nr:hypothetical protein [Nocardia abscessus]